MLFGWGERDWAFFLLGFCLGLVVMRVCMQAFGMWTVTR